MWDWHPQPAQKTKMMKTDNAKTSDSPGADSPPSSCSDSFEFRLPSTDGGLPFDFVDIKNDDYDCACVYRGDDDLGYGSRLLEAWDNYLYTVPEGAPVSDDDLSRMWAAYNEWSNSPNAQHDQSTVKPAQPTR